MEIVGDKKDIPPPSDQPQAANSSNEKKELSPLDKKYYEAVAAVSREYGEKGDENKDENKEEKVDVAERVSDDPLLNAAADMSSASLSKAKDMLATNVDALITKKHKDAFADCLVSGERYTESFSLFGGKLRIKVRCRSVEETDAILSYSRRKVSTGEVKSDTEYSSLMRKLLIAAQVSELNGVEYPPLRKPLLFSETPDGINPPAWEEDLGRWSQKSDAVISALTGAILEFEARYWQMVSRATDENFWNPGESTGE